MKVLNFNACPRKCQSKLSEEVTNVAKFENPAAVASRVFAQPGNRSADFTRFTSQSEPLIDWRLNVKKLICIFLSLNLLIASCGLNNPVDPVGNPVAENLDNLIRIVQSAENQPAIFMPDESREVIENFSLPLKSEIFEKLTPIKGVYTENAAPLPLSKLAAVDIPLGVVRNLLFVLEVGGEPLIPGPDHCLTKVPNFVLKVIDLSTSQEVGRVYIGFWRDGGNWIMEVFAEGERFPGPEGLGECWFKVGPSPGELVNEIEWVFKTSIIPALYEAKEKILIGAIAAILIALAVKYLAALIAAGAIAGGTSLLPHLIRPGA